MVTIDESGVGNRPDEEQEAPIQERPSVEPSRDKNEVDEIVRVHVCPPPESFDETPFDRKIKSRKAFNQIVQWKHLVEVKLGPEAAKLARELAHPDGIIQIRKLLGYHRFHIKEVPQKTTTVPVQANFFHEQMWNMGIYAFAVLMVEYPVEGHQFFLENLNPDFKHSNSLVAVNSIAGLHFLLFNNPHLPFDEIWKQQVQSEEFRLDDKIKEVEYWSWVQEGLSPSYGEIDGEELLNDQAVAGCYLLQEIRPGYQSWIQDLLVR